MSSDDRIRDAIAGFVRRTHQDLDAQSPRLVADVAGIVKGERQRWRDAHVEAFVRLATASRQISTATSLSGVLKALSSGAMNEASRVALLLVQDDQLRLWGHFGFGDALAPSDMVLGRGGPFDQAAQSLEAVPVHENAGESHRPAFLKLPPGHSALVVPLVVGGNVVALLYADGLDRRSEIDEAPVWKELVEVLVRNAALRLENVTTLRTVEVLTQPA